MAGIGLITPGGSGTSGSSLPAPTTGDAGKVVTVKTDETGYELDVPGGGSSATGIGDFIRWHRDGTSDASTGTVDWTVDVETSSGTTIAIDSGSGWIAAWGYPAPHVTEDGLYLVVVERQLGSGGTDGEESFSVGFWDDAGNPATPLPGGSGPTIRSGRSTLSGVPAGSVATTVLLPAGTHIDVGATDAGAHQLLWAVMIQRLAGSGN